MEEIKEKKPGFFKRLEKSKKGQVLFFVVSMCVIVLAYLVMLPGVKREVQTQFVEDLSVVEDEQILFSVSKLQWKFVKQKGYHVLEQSTCPNQ